MTVKPAVPSAHDLHERLLVVRFATGDDDLKPAERSRALAQIHACNECAAIADDVKLIARANAASIVPSRPRDFRLTSEQAASLRGTPFGRMLRRISAPSFGSLRPLATAAVAIGLILVVAGTALPRPAGSGTRSFGAPASPAGERPTNPAQPAPVAAATQAATEAEPPEMGSPDSLPIDTTSGNVADTTEPYTPAQSGSAGRTGSESVGAATATASPTTDAKGASTPPVATSPPRIADIAGPTPAPTREATQDLAANEARPDVAAAIALLGAALAGIGVVILLLTWLARRSTRDRLLP